MPRFRKKSVTFEAVRWDDSDDATLEIVSWNPNIRAQESHPPKLLIPSRVGTLTAHLGDWVIRDAGRLSVCEPDIFAATYEPAE